MLHLSWHQSLLSVGLASKTCQALASDAVVWRDFFHRNIGWRLKSDHDWLEEVLASVSETHATLLLPQGQSRPVGGAYDLRSLHRHLMRENSSASVPRVHRLNWKSLYALRYRLAGRWGDVPCRSGRPWDRELSSWSETFSGEEDSHSCEGNVGSESSDEELSRRRRIEREEQLVRTPRQRRRTVVKSRCQSHQKLRRRAKFIPDVRTLSEHEDSVYCVKTCLPPRNFAPSLGYIVTGSRDATIRIWSIESGRCTHVLRHGHSKSILSLDICPDGRLMVSSSSDQKLGIWSWFGCAEAAEAARRGRSWRPQLIDRWNCHTTVMDVRVTDRYLVLGLKHGQVRCYRRLRPEEIQFTQPASTAESRRLFERVSIVHSHSCSVNDMKIKGDLAATGYANGELEVIHIPTGVVRHRLPKQRGVACIDYGDDLLVCGSSDLNIYCFRASTGALLATLRGHEGLPRSVQLDPEKALLVSVGYDGVVNLWDLTSLLPREKIRSCALGDDWQAHGWRLYRHGQWRSASQRDLVDRDEASQGEYFEDEQSHPITDASESSLSFSARPSGSVPQILYPRYSSRDYAQRSGRGHDDERHDASHRPVRLFDVAFDGKRLITVGEMRCIVVREFLSMADRSWIGWELFA